LPRRAYLPVISAKDFAEIARLGAFSAALPLRSAGKQRKIKGMCAVSARPVCPAGPFEILCGAKALFSSGEKKYG
jgi:hypothetical protein